MSSSTTLLTTTTTTTTGCPANVCKGGLLMGYVPGEVDWDPTLRGILYFCGLLWLFMGIAIASEIFMEAIEKITSLKRRIVDPKTGRGHTYVVWNETVANLTLMALGSSAPEILLSVIELLSNELYSGALGPSTIVGSAAFNLFVITAVCVSAIPSTEIRRIKTVSVYSVTATFSILAYIWLVFIVSVTSKDVIEIWEAVVTFSLFPLLVVCAFCADKGYFNRCMGIEEDDSEGADKSAPAWAADMDREEIAAAEVKLKKEYGLELTDEQIALMIQSQGKSGKSKAAYRIEATRNLFGNSKGKAEDATPVKQSSNQVSLNAVVPIANSASVGAGGGGTSPAPDCVVSFSAHSFAVKECVGCMKLRVRRTGDISLPVSVDYASRDGKAKAKEDYEPILGSLKFNAGDTEKHIEVNILNDNATEDDEDFYVELSNISCALEDGSASIGSIGVCRIFIIDDDSPGMLVFEEDCIEVQEDAEDSIVNVVVKRVNGSSGKIGCSFFTEQGSATQGYDYLHQEGQLSFEDGQLSNQIPITICAKGRYDNKEEFRLVMIEPTGGAAFDATRDGGSEKSILTIVIKANEAHKTHIDRLAGLLRIDRDKAAVGSDSWKEKFKLAFSVTGDDDVKPGAFDYILHFFNFFWKFLGAFVPPVDYCGGWLCFSCALIFIGLLTAIVGDLAAMLGCVTGIDDTITAITLVALGTSLPDTFASKQAAVQDPYADASVGNVTGSNSVNVFLGLGLPWTVGSIYWTASGRTSAWQREYENEGKIDWASINQGGGKFVVIGGDLGFSVALFSGLAVCCIIVLLLRRKFLGGELGGPAKAKYATSGFLVLLWIIYIIASAAVVISNKTGCD
eukprot:TRINITY_DN2456_c1_g1_i1.p1 TRINITY_DN2456_c1_g1~~TRINITY_DN2456_c1_g1_i1.p1  ORF type:complete len:852 (+),score=156.15 TRINITY_DN2456_c1_g1_i1:62-2617(+)